MPAAGLWRAAAGTKFRLKLNTHTKRSPISTPPPLSSCARGRRSPDHAGPHADAAEAEEERRRLQNPRARPRQRRQDDDPPAARQGGPVAGAADAGLQHAAAPARALHAQLRAARVHATFARRKRTTRARAAGWDIGGQKSIRAYWRNYYDKTEGLVYVIDSADTQRLEETSIELGQLLADPKLENTPLLVFANKQDLINAAEVEEIVSVLDLKQIRVRPWHIQPCNAREGDGLAEGMEWLVTEVNAME